jgi:putative acetyltransferase
MAPQLSGGNQAGGQAITGCACPVRIGQARALFREYEADLLARHGVTLCFQNFEAELAGLPGLYSPPAGTLLIAGEGLGCVAVRPCPEEGSCELKRLYVAPAARGTGLGRRLVREAVAFARSAGYRTMRLDTLPAMKEAIRLYEAEGFERRESYNATPHGLWFEVRLQA